jgi:dipeptidyl aminopeptidase/acylaminoacyl peptidase
MQPYHRCHTLAALSAVLLSAATARSGQAQTPDRHLTPRNMGGACTSWDLVGIDAPGRRFYVPCGDHVAAFDLDSGKASTIAGFSGASAIATAPDLHRAFVNDAGKLTVFDTRSGRVIASVAGAGGDGIAYDPVTQRVFPFADTVHVISGVSLREVGRVVLGHVKPESGAADGTGRVVVTLEKSNAVAVIDARTLQTKFWTLGRDCEYPKSLVVDTAFRRVVVGCAKTGNLASIDAATGRVTSSIPLTEPYMDQSAYDQALHLLVSPGLHVVTIVNVAPDGSLRVADTVRTSEPTRPNVGIDPIKHIAWFAVADWVDSTDPAKGGRPETFGATRLRLDAFATRESSTELRIEDLLRAARLPSQNGQASTLSVSPDGRRVAFVMAGMLPPAHSDGAGQDNPDPAPDVVGGGVWVIDVRSHQSMRIPVRTRTAWAPSWSPNGERLAFLADSAGLTQLWTWSRRTATARATPHVRLRFSRGSHAVRWLRDNRTVLTELAAPTVSDPALPHAARGSSPPSDTLGATTVQVLRHVPSSGSSIMADTSSEGNAVTRRSDIVLLDVDSGHIERLVSGVKASWYNLSPDERHLAYTVSNGMVGGDINDRVVFDLMVSDRAKPEPRVVAHDILMNWTGASVRWSPDSRQVAYVGGPLPEGPLVNIRRTATSVFAVPGWCFVVPIDGAAPKQIGIRAVAKRQGPPIWDSTGSALYALGSDTLWRLRLNTGAIDVAASLGGRRVQTPLGLTSEDAYGGPVALSVEHPVLFIHAYDDRHQRQGLYKADLSSGAVAPVLEMAANIAGIAMAGTGAEAEVVYQREDYDWPRDLWLWDSHSGQPIQLTHSNPKLERLALGKRQMVAWLTADGDSASGLLLLPANYAAGHRYPMVTWVYAGQRWGTQFQHSFGVITHNAVYNAHLLATRGYAVFVPDIPFPSARMGTAMADIAKIVLPGVSRVVELGIADSSRLGLWGQSFGGYTVLSLLVQSSRFRAAIVAASAPLDLIASYERLDVNGNDWVLSTEQGQGRLGGSLWEYRDRYIENSPFFYLDRVRTPVLIQYGSADELAPFSRSLFVGLRRLNQRVELLRYEGENHVVLSLANQVDYWHRAIGWFDEHLKGASVAAARAER